MVVPFVVLLQKECQSYSCDVCSAANHHSISPMMVPDVSHYKESFYRVQQVLSIHRVVSLTFAQFTV